MDGYKYKFMDHYAVQKKIDISYAVNEATKCLDSEGVTISPASFVKCVDVYLRVIGMCRSENADEFPPVNILTGVVSFKDRDFGDNSDRIELCQQLFTLINECVDDAHKFPEEDLDQIKANVPIVMKETTCFCNDIMNCIYDEYTHDNVVSVVAIIKISNESTSNSDHTFGMQIMYDINLETIDVNIESSVLVPFSDDTATGILIESFPEDVREAILKKMPVKEETSNE